MDSGRKLVPALHKRVPGRGHAAERARHGLHRERERRAAPGGRHALRAGGGAGRALAGALRRQAGRARARAPRRPPQARHQPAVRGELPARARGRALRRHRLLQGRQALRRQQQDALARVQEEGLPQQQAQHTEQDQKGAQAALAQVQAGGVAAPHARVPAAAGARRQLCGVRPARLPAAGRAAEHHQPSGDVRHLQQHPIERGLRRVTRRVLLVVTRVARRGVRASALLRAFAPAPRLSNFELTLLGIVPYGL